MRRELDTFEGFLGRDYSSILLCGMRTTLTRTKASIIGTTLDWVKIGIYVKVYN